MRLPVPLDPYLDEPEDGSDLLFDPTELAHYFPADVVAHLEQHGRALDAGIAEHVPPGLRHLPVGGELPVLVAVRMSLSFPLLIATVPLYELDRSVDPARPILRRVVFSDGGITSNFPVHFFDSPLPRRPTFGLQLTTYDPSDEPDRADPCHAVEPPRPPDQPARVAWVRLGGLTDFLLAVGNALQDWRDNAQAQLPGFRERTAQIKLAPDEGGLNLAMDESKVTYLTAVGACAGRELGDLFAGPSTHWDDHRFTRYRTAMSGEERYLRAYARGYRASATGALPYPERVAAGLAPPFAFGSEELLAHAQRTTEEYLRLADAQPSLDDAGVPRPRAALRAVPNA